MQNVVIQKIDLDSTGALRQVFIRVYRLEKQSVMFVFSTQLCKLLPLSPSLWLSFPLPPFPVWISILYTRIHSVRGGGSMGFWDSGLRQLNTCSKVTTQVNFLDNDILNCLLRVLSFYEYMLWSSDWPIIDKRPISIPWNTVLTVRKNILIGSIFVANSCDTKEKTDFMSISITALLFLNK